MINFLRYRSISLFSLALLVVIFVGGVWYKTQERGSAFAYSVDFTGGTQVLFEFAQPVTGPQVVAALEEAGYQSPVIREFSSTELLVRVKAFEGDVQGITLAMKQALEKALGENTVTIKQTDSVGPGVGQSLWQNSISAILVALLVMLLYIAFRFRSFSYAIASIVALTHDSLVILAFVLWFDYEISMYIISAIIFTLGYSINDTIVIFSRIRENINKTRNKGLHNIVNLSINETLRRTILTSLATCLVVVSLLIFGGETLRALSTTLLIGMVFGTYSSIYIASPIMMLVRRGA